VEDNLPLAAEVCESGHQEASQGSVASAPSRHSAGFIRTLETWAARRKRRISTAFQTLCVRDGTGD
jgi:hypothetical protein